MNIEETRAGRPRDPERDTAILAATLDLLGEVGYDEVTVRAIATRAGAGLATIYRRWPTKEELVVDAVATNEPPLEPRPGAEPVEAMVEMISGLAELLQGAHRGMIPNVIGQLWRNPLLAEALRERVIFPRLSIATEQLRSVPGVDPARVDDAAELIAASVIFQIAVLGRHLSADDIRRLVDLVIRAAR